MQATKHLYNPGPNVMFVAGLMIPPGEGRDVPLLYLPAELQDAPAPAPTPSGPTPEELAAELLKKPVKDVAAELPTLSDEALALLAALEGEAAHPRKTLLEAVAAEELKRVDAALQTEADALTAQQLAALTPEQQAAVAAVVQD